MRSRQRPRQTCLPTRRSRTMWNTKLATSALEQLERSMRVFEPEVVFHLAAQPLVRCSYASPVETYATNVLGTAHVLDAVRSVAFGPRSCCHYHR